MTGDEIPRTRGELVEGFDDDEVEELKGDTFGEPVAPPLAPSACTPGLQGLTKPRRRRRVQGYSG